MRLLALTLLVGCATELEIEDVEGLAFDVATTGPYNPGYKLLSVTYDPGLGEGNRTLDVHVWYPTEDVDFDEVSYSYEVFRDEAVVPEASLAPSAYGSSYPVHVYSHGDRGFGGSSAFMARYFASHGWITISPDHLDNLTFDSVEPRPTSLYVHRATDLSAVLDDLAENPDFTDAETSRVVLSAHSFGAYSTWAIAGATYENVADFCVSEDCTTQERAAFEAGLDDERVVATIPMAGTIRRSWFGDTGHRDVDLPVFFMSGTEDVRGQQEQWDAMDTLDFTWIDIEGACHNAFALGSCTNLDTDEGFGIMQTYALAFARRHVLDDAQSGVLDILDGTAPLSDKVAFQRMNGE